MGATNANSNTEVPAVVGPLRRPVLTASEPSHSGEASVSAPHPRITAAVDCCCSVRIPGAGLYRKSSATPALRFRSVSCEKFRKRL